jgi:hypothetical protein
MQHAIALVRVQLSKWLHDRLQLPVMLPAGLPEAAIKTAGLESFCAYCLCCKACL